MEKQAKDRNRQFTSHKHMPTNVLKDSLIDEENGNEKKNTISHLSDWQKIFKSGKVGMQISTIILENHVAIMVE